MEQSDAEAEKVFGESWLKRAFFFMYSVDDSVTYAIFRAEMSFKIIFSVKESPASWGLENLVLGLLLFCCKGLQ